MFVSREISEAQRLEALHRTGLLDTSPEPVYDAYARLAIAVTGAPTAFVSLVDSDRQWFKAKVNADMTETSRDVAFCDHAIRQPGVLEVPDAKEDDRFADNPLVTGAPHIRFYAGMPLVLGTGEAIGTLCVIDHAPRRLSPQMRDGLRDLGNLVVREIEQTRLADHARKEADRLAAERDAAKEAASSARLIARELNHRMGNLFAQVSGLVAMTEREHGGQGAFVADVRQRVIALKSVSDLLVNEGWRGARLSDVVEAALAPVALGGDPRLTVEGPSLSLTDRASLNVALVLSELGTNALKHGALGAPEGRVTLSWTLDDGSLVLHWRESGGPPAAAPSGRRGFGSVLLTRVAPAGLMGEASQEFGGAGYAYRLSAPAEFVLLDEAANGPALATAAVS